MKINPELQYTQRLHGIAGGTKGNLKKDPDILQKIQQTLRDFIGLRRDAEDLTRIQEALKTRSG